MPFLIHSVRAILLAMLALGCGGGAGSPMPADGTTSEAGQAREQPAAAGRRPLPAEDNHRPIPGVTPESLIGRLEDEQGDVPLHRNYGGDSRDGSRRRNRSVDGGHPSMHFRWRWSMRKNLDDGGGLRTIDTTVFAQSRNADAIYRIDAIVIGENLDLLDDAYQSLPQLALLHEHARRVFECIASLPFEGVDRDALQAFLDDNHGTTAREVFGGVAFNLHRTTDGPLDVYALAIQPVD